MNGTEYSWANCKSTDICFLRNTKGVISLHFSLPVDLKSSLQVLAIETLLQRKIKHFLNLDKKHLFFKGYCHIL